MHEHEPEMAMECRWLWVSTCHRPNHAIHHDSMCSNCSAYGFLNNTHYDVSILTDLFLTVSYIKIDNVLGVS